MLIEIKKIDGIIEYCKLNSLDLDDFVNKCVNIGFTIERYGYSPIDNFRRENNIILNKVENEKESTREKIEERVLNEVETTKEKNVVNENDGKHEEQTVRDTGEKKTDNKEEIEKNKEKPKKVNKKRKIKVIKE